MRLAGTYAFLLVISVYVFSCVNGSSDTKPNNAGKAEESVTKGDLNNQQAYKEIFRVIDRDGQARVIVELKIEHVDTSRPSIIQKARDKLLQHLSGFHYIVLRQYSTLPMLVLEVDRQAFEILISSPLVDSVHIDSQMHKMNSD